MHIGAMNHPARDPLSEVRSFAAWGFDFVEITVEPPAAGPWQVDRTAMGELLGQSGLGVAGHTAYYLPLGHPFESVRRGAVEALISSAELLAALGSPSMTIHPDARAPLHERSFVIAQNLRSLEEIVAACRPLGIQVLVENLPGSFNTAEQLDELLGPMPELGLTLDVGHTNLRVSGGATLREILEVHGGRLAHVHLHDNRGGLQDLHLPLGAGTLDIAGSLELLRAAGFDGRVTLEVFSPDPEYLQLSARKLRRMWAWARPAGGGG